MGSMSVAFVVSSSWVVGGFSGRLVGGMVALGPEVGRSSTGCSSSGSLAVNFPLLVVDGAGCLGSLVSQYPSP